MNLFFFKTNKGLIEWDSIGKVHEFLLKHDGKKMYAEIGRETGVRTPDQNAALHLWCEMVAKELNDSGQTLQEVLSKTIEIEWNKELIKELLWRKVQIALTGKKSTTSLNKTNEINEIYEHLNRFLGEKCKIHVPFPNEETKQKTGMDIVYPQESNQTSF